MNTKHADTQAQRRGIPPFIDQALDQFGFEQYGERGSITVFFNKKSIRNMEREYGRPIVSKLEPWLGAYKVRSSNSDRTITIGFLTKRVNRR